MTAVFLLPDNGSSPLTCVVVLCIRGAKTKAFSWCPVEVLIQGFAKKKAIRKKQKCWSRPSALLLAYGGKCIDSVPGSHLALDCAEAVVIGTLGREVLKSITNVFGDIKREIVNTARLTISMQQSRSKVLALVTKAVMSTHLQESRSWRVLALSICRPT